MVPYLTYPKQPISSYFTYTYPILVYVRFLYFVILTQRTHMKLKKKNHSAFISEKAQTKISKRNKGFQFAKHPDVMCVCVQPAAYMFDIFIFEEKPLSHLILFIFWNENWKTEKWIRFCAGFFDYVNFVDTHTHTQFVYIRLCVCGGRLRGSLSEFIARQQALKFNWRRIDEEHRLIGATVLIVLANLPLTQTQKCDISKDIQDSSNAELFCIPRANLCKLRNYKRLTFI